MVGVPFAASRVFDELASLALDTAPGTRRRKCGQKSLDRADDVIDGAEFFTELPTRDTTLPFGRDPRLLSDVLAIISPLLLFARLCPDSRWVGRPRQPHRFLHQCRAILILGGPIPAR